MQKEFVKTESGEFEIKIIEPEFNDMGFIENNLIILTKQTLDYFLKQENPADLIALYSFYYYTAKWQKTNLPKCTTGYVSKGLKWAEAKVRKAKKVLIASGLIQDFQRKDKNNKIEGHYIKMNYILKQSTVKTHTDDFAVGGDIDTLENQDTNALSAINLNALSAINENACQKQEKTHYGELSNVLLTENEYLSLIKDYGEENTKKYINNLSLYEKIEKYTNHNLTIRKWMNKDNIKKVKDLYKTEPRVYRQSNCEPLV